MLFLYKWIGAPGFGNPGETASNRGIVEPAFPEITAKLTARPPPTAPTL